jgi:hypothetical protein
MDPKELVEKTIRQPNLLTVKQRAELARHNLELLRENERLKTVLWEYAWGLKDDGTLARQTLGSDPQ